MYRYLLLICLALLDDVTAKIPAAPGEKKCPALKVGAHVITDHSCTSGPSDVDTVCSFECSKGYQRNGPGHKRCQLDGSWTNGDDPVKCDDVNECDTANGFCSHLCMNKPGSYKCKCPPPLILDPKNQRKCKGPGVQLTCDTNHMEIVLPKNLIHNLHHEHLSLIDPSCRANGNATHYSLSTDITKCGTTSHVYKNFIVYTNRVIESPNEDSDVITHVGVNEIKVPFSCYFNDLEIVHTVGYKPVAQKIHVYVKGRGEYALSLDIFKDESYGEGSRALAPSSAKYTQDDFPIEVHLRERVFVQASLDTREKDLKIFASNCCSTPMQDHEATMKFRHALIVEGCPRDPTVQFHSSSDPTKFRFSFEAFQFLGNHDYVFIHCRVHVCDVNDNKSRCAKGCLPGFGKPPVQDHPGKIKKAQTPEKLAQPNGKSVKKVVASGTSKKAEVRSASKKSTVKAAAKVLVKAPSITKNKVQDQPKVSKKTDAEIELRHLMKRAAATRFQKRGVLGSTDLTSIGPVLLEHAKRNGKREPRPKKVFADAKGIGMNHDVKQKNKRTSVAPSATNIVLVVLTVASIMALVGVAYLGRKATKIVNNPYNYDSLAVYQ